MAGGQPWRGHDYKTGIMLSGDGAGRDASGRTGPRTSGARSPTSWSAPGSTRSQAPGATNNWAGAGSLEVDIFKGFTIKPTFTYANYIGGNCGTNNLGTYAYGGYQPNQCNDSTTVRPVGPPLRSRGVPAEHQRATPSVATSGGRSAGSRCSRPSTTSGGRASRTGAPQPADRVARPPPASGASARTTSAPSSSIPSPATGIGPLNLQARIMYHPGSGGPAPDQQRRRHQLFQPINSGFGYMAGWTDIQTGGIDYITSMGVGSTEGLVLRSIAELRQVRADLPRRRRRLLADAALVFTWLGNIAWTANKVNTQSLFSTIGLIPCPAVPSAVRDRYGHPCTSNGRGTEQLPRHGSRRWALTYRFAPNVALDLVGAYLWSGRRLQQRGHRRQAVIGPSVRDADDVWKITLAAPLHLLVHLYAVATRAWANPMPSFLFWYSRLDEEDGSSRRSLILVARCGGHGRCPDEPAHGRRGSPLLQGSRRPDRRALSGDQDRRGRSQRRSRHPRGGPRRRRAARGRAVDLP